MPQLLMSSVPATSTALQLNQAIKMTFQLSVQGSGSVSASAVVEGSHDGLGWLNIATLEASGTNYGTDGGTFETFFPQVRCRLTAVTGTATVFWGS